MRIDLVLPFPPSVNTYWRQWQGRTILSRAGRQFKAEVKDIIVEEKVPSVGNRRLSVKMLIRPRDKRRIDLDNRIKAVLDSLEDAGVFEGDAEPAPT